MLQPFFASPIFKLRYPDTVHKHRGITEGREGGLNMSKIALRNLWTAICLTTLPWLVQSMHSLEMTAGC